jgi:catechol 2,3-dioxygenase-like lactoylglutathione lyase family enzyme
MVKVTGLDHIVLTVADVEASAAWYQEKLGVELIRMEEWRRGEVLFPSLRLDATTLIDLFQGDRTGENLNHFAVVVEGADLAAVAASGEFELHGSAEPADLFGAQGQGLGIYVKDPDGNVVELRTYPA